MVGAMSEPTRFYLGTHQPHWLATTMLPLFVSDRRLRERKTLPRAAARWALDSGGFTELSAHGSWDHGPSPTRYVEHIRRYHEHVGRLDWAASQDWMCEPQILARIGLSVAEHQRRTVDNYLRLRDLAAAAGLPDGIVRPTIQGWLPDDYLRCLEAYDRVGVDLRAEGLVCVGTVCRRQATDAAADIITLLWANGLTRLHGFGLKIAGLRAYGSMLESVDSMAWSYGARRTAPLPGCRHANCANCSRYAYRWAAERVAPMLRRRATHTQLPLLGGIVG